MSTSSLYVFRNGLAEWVENYKNSHGVAPMVWTTLCTKYKRVMYPDAGVFEPAPFMMQQWDDLFKKYKELEMRGWEEAVLEFTFDNALVKREDFMLLSAALHMFWEAHATKNYVCHLDKIAEKLTLLYRTDETVEAAGLRVTSVSGNPWTVYDNEIEDYGPYSLHTGTKHWFLKFPRSDEGDSAKA